MGISFWQVLLVLVLIVLLFGRGRISDLMGDVARGIKSFKKGLADEETPETPPKEIPESPADKVDSTANTKTTDQSTRQ